MKGAVESVDPVSVQLLIPAALRGMLKSAGSGDPATWVEKYPDLTTQLRIDSAAWAHERGDGENLQDSFYNSFCTDERRGDNIPEPVEWRYTAIALPRVRSAGFQKARATGNPFSVMSLYRGGDLKVTQNIVYGHDGRCIVAVDFAQHGISASGHWHPLIPGVPDHAAQGEGHSYSWELCPWPWLAIPATNSDGQALQPFKSVNDQDHCRMSCNGYDYGSFKWSLPVPEPIEPEQEPAVPFSMTMYLVLLVIVVLITVLAQRSHGKSPLPPSLSRFSLLATADGLTEQATASSPTHCSPEMTTK